MDIYFTTSVSTFPCFQINWPREKCHKIIISIRISASMPWMSEHSENTSKLQQHPPTHPSPSSPRCSAHRSLRTMGKSITMKTNLIQVSSVPVHSEIILQSTFTDLIMFSGLGTTILRNNDPGVTVMILNVLQYPT